MRNFHTCPTLHAYTVGRVRVESAHSLQLHQIPDEVVIYRIHGPFLFGGTDRLIELEREVPALPKVVILWLRNMTAIDGTGLHALEHFADVRHKSHRLLLLCGMRTSRRAW